MHGANRLASNSLLETIVFAKRIVERTLVIGDEPTAAPRAPDAVALPEPRLAEPPLLSRSGLQALLWEQVGIVRDRESLRRAGAVLSAWHAVALEPADRPTHELANLVLYGRLVVEAAQQREESRGAHHRRDFPEPREEWRRHIVFRAGARPGRSARSDA